MGLLSDANANKKREEDANGAGGHVHQCSLSRGVAQVADEGCGVGGDNTAGDRELGKWSAINSFPRLSGPVSYQHDSQEHEVELGVYESFDDLLKTELAVLDTGLIDANVLEESNLFAIREPLGLHRSIWEKQDDAQAGDDGGYAESNEHGAPSGQGSIGAHVLEAVGDGAADNLANTETKIPEGEAGSLFGFGVPLTADEHKRGADRGFEDTEEDARDEEGLVVVGSGTTCSRDTPQNDVGSEPFGSRHNLKEVG
jgi:hypothetical protein